MLGFMGFIKRVVDLTFKLFWVEETKMVNMRREKMSNVTPWHDMDIRLFNESNEWGKNQFSDANIN